MTDREILLSLCASASLADRIAELEAALRTMTEHYVRLAGCGDCGFWDPEAEPEVIAARAALNPSARSE